MSRARRARRRAQSTGAAAAAVAAGVVLAACGGGASDATGDSPSGRGSVGDAEPADEQRSFRARLGPLNGSGAEGEATLALLDSTLTARLDANGLEPLQEHVQHIHRLEGGEPGRCPTEAADGDGDGMVSLEESLPAYGPVAVKLEPFPRADGQGRVSFEDTLEAPPGVEPLTDRVIVVYGRDVRGVYDPTVPVACGRIR